MNAHLVEIETEEEYQWILSMSIYSFLFIIPSTPTCISLNYGLLFTWLVCYIVMRAKDYMNNSISVCYALFNWLDQKVYTCVNLFDDVRIARAKLNYKE